MISDALEGAEPVSPVYGYRRTQNRRRRYDRTRTPENFLVAGDAACVLNPSYGQGMTLAALSALVLRRSLCGSTSHLARNFHRAQTKAVAPAWRTTTASDTRWAATSVKELGIFDRYAHRVSDEVIRTAARRDEATRTLLEVKNLLAHPVKALRPGLILPAALRALIR